MPMYVVTRPGAEQVLIILIVRVMQFRAWPARPRLVRAIYDVCLIATRRELQYSRESVGTPSQ